MLAAGNFGDRHAAVGYVHWSSVTKTPMNSQGKLVYCNCCGIISQISDRLWKVVDNNSNFGIA